MICAIEIQRVLRARNASLSADHRMDFRMGIHMGDVRVEGGRIYGDGVNIAARLEALADAGGICISSTVHDQVKSPTSFQGPWSFVFEACAVSRRVRFPWGPPITNLVRSGLVHGA